MGLVDKIGDLGDALDSAAKLAEIEDFSVKTYKKPLDPFELFINGLLENINIKINIDPRLRLINSTLEKHLKIIDPE